MSYFPGATYISYVPSSFVSYSWASSFNSSSCTLSPFSTVPSVDQSIFVLTSDDLYILMFALCVPLLAVGSV